jgi:hypothetical protein
VGTKTGRPRPSVAPTGRVPTAVASTAFVPTAVASADLVPSGVPILLDSSALLSHLDGSESVPPIAAGPSTHRAVIGFLYGFPNLRLVAVDGIAGQLAAGLGAHAGFSAADALVLASGLAVGARHVVTNDASWRPRLREAWPDATVLTLVELSGAA